MQSKKPHKVLLGSRIVYIEPAIRVLVGIFIFLIAMGFFLVPTWGGLWLGLSIFLVIGLLGSGLTQFCLMAWTLRGLGLRSEWDELKALERAHAIAQTRSSYLDTLNLLDEVIVELSPNGDLLWKSDRWSSLFGSEEMRSFRECMTDEDLATFDEMADILLSGMGQRGKIHFYGCGRDNHPRWIEGRFTLFHDSDETPVLRGVLRDITEAYEERLAIAHKATHDELTGLPNRALLEDRLEQAKARADRQGTALAVLFIDLDHFKKVNDELGHHVGDELLVSVAKALTAGVRPSDTVARWGGDEFVALIPDLDQLDVARVVADGLLDAARHKLVGDAAKVVTFSMGVGFYPNNADNISDLLIKADQALYQAKSLGRDNVQYASRPEGSPKRAVCKIK